MTRSRLSFLKKRLNNAELIAFALGLAVGAAGALAGVILLSQPAGPRMIVAVACVMLAALGVTLSDRKGDG